MIVYGRPISITVRIREASYTNASGTFNVHPDLVRGHLVIIASGGTGELAPSFGDNPDPNDNNYSIAEFNPGSVDTSNASGRVKARLKELIDQPDNYIIIGVGWDFIWGNGDTIEASPGGTLGDTVFYDTSNCNGDGRWIWGVNGNKECTSSVGILYHELAHAYLDQPITDPITAVEAEAITEENVLREALGLVLRDKTRLESACGCPDGDCCIVASVATASPFSQEVNMLRRVRDYTLRSSEIGTQFFNALHYEYYSFSVEVCRIMVLHPKAQYNVEQWLVRPLVQILKIAFDYTRHPNDLIRLGEHLLKDISSDFIWRKGEKSEWKQAHLFINAIVNGESLLQALPELDEGTVAICEMLTTWVPQCPHVRWGIANLLDIYILGRIRFNATDNAEVVGLWLKDALDRWLGNMPLDYALKHISDRELSSDLHKLTITVFTSKTARQYLGKRLACHLGSKPGSALEKILHNEGYRP
ncbi:MAG: hypothetical protein ACFFCW_07205 [Candidatus Hodarchaeota archaeon]